jgi:Trk K+ transport system NAD-binding subunit
MGNPIESLGNANLGTAKSVVALTEDPMLNLEIALIAKQVTQQHQNTANIIVRTFNETFSTNITGLLPESRAMCAYALSAEAFAGAAFGENMLSVFRLHGRTVLVAEYQIETGDTLIGLSLAQIAYGYSVVPIYLRAATPKSDGKQEFWLPSDNERLHNGDRLVVLSSSAGLQRIERGQLYPPRLWRLQAKAPLNQNVLLELGNQLSNQTGCDLDSARKFASALPNAIDLMLYDTQAYRLGQILTKLLPVYLLPY